MRVGVLFQMPTSVSDQPVCRFLRRSLAPEFLGAFSIKAAINENRCLRHLHHPSIKSKALRTGAPLIVGDLFQGLDGTTGG